MYMHIHNTSRQTACIHVPLLDGEHMRMCGPIDIPVSTNILFFFFFFSSRPIPAFPFQVFIVIYFSK